MPSPYRESDDTPRTPFEELAWRRRVARSARWAELLAVVEMALLLATHWLPLPLALAGAEAWLAVGGALAVATWMFTAPRPGSRARRSDWLFRVGLPAYLGVMGLYLLGMHLGIACYALGALLIVASLARGGLLPRTRVASFDPRSVFSIGTLIEALFVCAVTTFALILERIVPGLFPVYFAAIAARATRHSVLPVEHEWWFDNQTATPGEWVSLFVYRNGRAEVPWDDDRPRWFASREQAVWWLSNQGYLPAERALAERLVERTPTDTLPLLKQRNPPRPHRNKPRVRDAEPRVRVAAEAEAVDTEADDIEEPALDDAEPPRAVAVRDPRAPRT